MKIGRTLLEDITLSVMGMAIVLLIIYMVGAEVANAGRKDKRIDPHTIEGLNRAISDQPAAPVILHRKAAKSPSEGYSADDTALMDALVEHSKASADVKRKPGELPPEEQRKLMRELFAQGEGGALHGE